jgi:hypothetical protein
LRYKLSKKKVRIPRFFIRNREYLLSAQSHTVGGDE